MAVKCHPIPLKIPALRALASPRRLPTLRRHALFCVLHPSPHPHELLVRQAAPAPVKVAVIQDAVATTVAPEDPVTAAAMAPAPSAATVVIATSAAPETPVAKAATTAKTVTIALCVMIVRRCAPPALVVQIKGAIIAPCVKTAVNAAAALASATASRVTVLNAVTVPVPIAPALSATIARLRTARALIVVTAQKVRAHAALVAATVVSALMASTATVNVRASAQSAPALTAKIVHNAPPTVALAAQMANEVVNAVASVATTVVTAVKVAAINVTAVISAAMVIARLRAVMTVARAQKVVALAVPKAARSTAMTVEIVAR